jgi:hypothetical protein
VTATSGRADSRQMKPMRRNATQVSGPIALPVGLFPGGSSTIEPDVE